MDVVWTGHLALNCTLVGLLMNQRFAEEKKRVRLRLPSTSQLSQKIFIRNNAAITNTSYILFLLTCPDELKPIIFIFKKNRKTNCSSRYNMEVKHKQRINLLLWQRGSKETSTPSLQLTFSFCYVLCIYKLLLTEVYIYIYCFIQLK